MDKGTSKRPQNLVKSQPNPETHTMQLLWSKVGASPWPPPWGLSYVLSKKTWQSPGISCIHCPTVGAPWQAG